MWDIYLVSTVCPAACAVMKAHSAEGPKRDVRARERGQAAAGWTMGVRHFWQLHSVEERLLCVAFTSNCNLFGGC